MESKVQLRIIHGQLSRKLWELTLDISHPRGEISEPALVTYPSNASVAAEANSLAGLFPKLGLEVVS
jgi:hypothetical protein